MMTREDWLTQILFAARPWFKDAGFPLPEKIRIGCGWPSARALSQKRRRLGECWRPEAAKDNAHNIIISLFLDQTIEVAGTLIHELAHAATPGCGHRKEFVKCIRSVGLLGKPTEAAEPNPELSTRLNIVFEKIGQYPHASVDGQNRKKQSTRLVKLQCECGYTVRTTRKWIDEAGFPTCPCGGLLCL